MSDGVIGYVCICRVNPHGLHREAVQSLVLSVFVIVLPSLVHLVWALEPGIALAECIYSKLLICLRRLRILPPALDSTHLMLTAWSSVKVAAYYERRLAWSLSENNSNLSLP